MHVSFVIFFFVCLCPRVCNMCDFVCVLSLVLVCMGFRCFVFPLPGLYVCDCFLFGVFSSCMYVCNCCCVPRVCLSVFVFCLFLLSPSCLYVCMLYAFPSCVYSCVFCFVCVCFVVAFVCVCMYAVCCFVCFVSAHL